MGRIFYSPNTSCGKLLRERGRFSNYSLYRKHHLSILRASKQIHDEAEHVYLTSNMFVLPPFWSYAQPLRPDAERKKPELSKRWFFSKAGLNNVRHINVGFSIWSPEVEDAIAEYFKPPATMPRVPHRCSRTKEWNYTHMLILRRQTLFHDNILVAVTKFEGLQCLELDFTAAGCCPFHDHFQSTLISSENGRLIAVCAGLAISSMRPCHNPARLDL